MPALLTWPALSFTIHDDGTLAVRSPWHPCVLFTDDLIGRADGHRLTLRADELTIRCTNGGAVYALEPSEFPGLRVGRLLRSWA